MTHEQFLKQWKEFQQQSLADGRFAPREVDWHQILDDDKPAHDEKDFSPDYWLHVSWAAYKIAALNPKYHVDIASYVYFSGILSAFIPTEFFDIRPLPYSLPKLRCKSCDVTKLPWSDGQLHSISMLHSIEHVGLGRYGDQLDASGDLRAANELSRVLAEGGQLLIVAPMNEQPRVTFNSDRYYSFAMLSEMFASLKMVEFEFIHEGKIKNGPVPGGHYTGMAVFTK